MVDEIMPKKHIRTFRSKKLHPEHVKLLNEAIRKNAKGGDLNVTIKYNKPDGTVSERKIKPLGVKDKSLLLAHCHERNAIRSFRVERVSMIKQALFNFDPWGKKKKEADLLEKRKQEALQQEKNHEDYLLGHIKKQNLEEHLKVLEHPKADRKYMMMEEIIRRHGDPYNVIRSNPGGGRGHGPYHPNYSDKFWERVGGKIDKNKKYMTFDQADKRRGVESKMEKSAFWNGFEKKAISLDYITRGVNNAGRHELDSLVKKIHIGQAVGIPPAQVAELGGMHWRDLAKKTGTDPKKLMELFKNHKHLFRKK